MKNFVAHPISWRRFTCTSFFAFVLITFTLVRSRCVIGITLQIFDDEKIESYFFLKIAEDMVGERESPRGTHSIWNWTHVLKVQITKFVWSGLKCHCHISKCMNQNTHKRSVFLRIRVYFGLKLDSTWAITWKIREKTESEKKWTSIRSAHFNVTHKRPTDSWFDDEDEEKKKKNWTTTVQLQLFNST